MNLNSKGLQFFQIMIPYDSLRIDKSAIDTIPTILSLLALKFVAIVEFHATFIALRGPVPPFCHMALIFVWTAPLQLFAYAPNDIALQSDLTLHFVIIHNHFKSMECFIYCPKNFIL